MSPTDEFDFIQKRASKGKVVRFADHEGHKLCEVFHFYCYDDRNKEKSKASRIEARAKPRPLTLITLPWAQDVISQRLQRTNVTLQNVVKTEKGIIGIAAVKNIGYHKDVLVRYSFNGWTTVNETLAAFYKQDSSHQLDYFVFVLSNKKAYFDIDWTLDFAICYRVNGHEYWDNNDGKNHRIQSS